MPDARRSRVLRSGPRRLTEWSGVVDQAYITVAAGTKVLIQSISFAEQATIIRNRGQFSVKSTQSAADAEIVGAVGFGIVSAEAFAAGVASIPGPLSQAEWGGWMVWRAFHTAFEFVSGVGVLLASKEWEIDSKAMRKVGANEVLVTIAESQAVAFEISVLSRTLIKLG